MQYSSPKGSYPRSQRAEGTEANEGMPMCGKRTLTIQHVTLQHIALSKDVQHVRYQDRMDVLCTAWLIF